MSVGINELYIIIVFVKYKNEFSSTSKLNFTIIGNQFYRSGL